MSTIATASAAARTRRLDNTLRAARRVARAAAAWVGRPWRMRMTQTYACILVVTTLLLSGTNDRLDRALLRSASTNLDHLSNRPVHALVSSAFWTERGGMLAFAAIALVVFSPLEAWAGPVRWLVVFVAGHVGATLVVAAGLAIALHVHAVNPNVTRSIDVGYSYAAWCAAAFLVYRWRSVRWRIAVAAMLVAVLIAGIVASRQYSSWGHLSAAAIGFALYPMRPRTVRPAAPTAPLPSAPTSAPPGIAGIAR